MSSEAPSVVTRLQSSGLFRSQGLIGGKWIDAYDGKTFKVWLKGFFCFLMLPISDSEFVKYSFQ